jgi:hypothetical protein
MARTRGAGEARLWTSKDWLLTFGCAHLIAPRRDSSIVSGTAAPPTNLRGVVAFLADRDRAEVGRAK